MDIKARLRNKYFWLAVASLVVVIVKQIKPDIVPSDYNSIINTIVSALLGIGILVDPSTPGISDNKPVQTIDNTTQY